MKSPVKVSDTSHGFDVTVLDGDALVKSGVFGKRLIARRNGSEYELVSVSRKMSQTVLAFSAE